ncbi:uncharacterized protein PGTG_17979 [Puccinia graminis f. sp. tritici CRL 75-36-700-3]|uniref:Uncharacterized protein n=1 Tax=Puccinia graminis f. sp. tritici (strain CRL 75-36-700-3 / race SCCL) TaxID=418459 RepID=E3L6Y0_PUCGT|nr:uncharacterized protein PGTG_17979 [Puccinia graminis f. sp. tritici CRL 75-36-700-3]EFP92305.2 hypothetical protein PGTG_17979 [Puccinia graminis f. sp. tritici CRL 75-36-700-3]
MLAKDIRLPLDNVPERTNPRFLSFAELQAIVAEQNKRIDSVAEEIKSMQQKDHKERMRVEALMEQVEAQMEQVNLLRKQAQMDAIHDFFRSIESTLCRRLGIEEDSCIDTLTKALKSGPTTWAELKTILNLDEKEDEEWLLATINGIKEETLAKCAHASNTSDEQLVLSTSLVNLAQNNFSLTPPQLDILQKLVDWVRVQD